MNYLKRSLSVLLITGLLSTNAQAFEIHFEANGVDLVTPVVETVKPVASAIAGLCKFLNHIHIPVFFIKTRESNQMSIMWRPLSYFAAIGATALGGYYLMTKADEEVRKKWDYQKEYSKLKGCAYGFLAGVCHGSSISLIMLLPFSNTQTRLPITNPFNN